MDTAAQVLLIIVSSVLAVFLIILGVALIYLIRVLKKAEQMANTMESAATAVKRGIVAAPFVKIISKLISKKKG